MFGRLPERDVRHLARVGAIRAACGGNDAQALARFFEDEQIGDDGTPTGRVEALLAATAHRWLAGRRTPLDLPGLCEVRGAGDTGFRQELRDPWPCSRDQIGHFLTAVGLRLVPGVVRQRRLMWSVRDLVGAPPGMSDVEVAIRLAIGHEKVADPWRFDPRTPWQVRRQFDSATTRDVAVFASALAWAADRPGLCLSDVQSRLADVQPGSGTGNSHADLVLTFLGFVFAERVERGLFSTNAQMARWVHQHVAADDGGPRATPARAPSTRSRGTAG